MDIRSEGERVIVRAEKGAWASPSTAPDGGSPPGSAPSAGTHDGPPPGAGVPRVSDSLGRAGSRTAGRQDRSDGNDAIRETARGRAETLELEFDAAIVSAGPWAGELLARAGLPLRITRQELVYLRIARNEHNFEPDRLPVWIDAATYDYGFPSDGRIGGAKLGLHRLGETVDPDSADLSVREEFIRDRTLYAAERLPDLAPEVTHAQVCLYTNAPDEDFIVDRAPDLPGVWLVSGCSGHGFKFTSLLGKIVADLATGDGPSRDLSRFSLSRFGGALPSQDR